MEGHRLRVGALAWSSSLLSSGSRDKSILQRDIRAQDDFTSKLSGHKSEVRLTDMLFSSWLPLNYRVLCFPLNLLDMSLYLLLLLE